MDGEWVDGYMDKYTDISRPAMLASKRYDSRDQGKEPGKEDLIEPNK